MNSQMTSISSGKIRPESMPVSVKAPARKDDLVWNKDRIGAVIRDLNHDDPNLQAARVLIAKTFAKEKMSKVCAADEAVLLDFLEGVLSPILEDQLSVAAFAIENQEPVGFCIQLSLEPGAGKSDGPEPPKELWPIFSFTEAMQQTFFDFLEHQSSFGAAINATGMKPAGFEEASRLWSAYQEGTFVHALMAGRKQDSNWGGIAEHVVRAAFYRAYKAGKRFVVAEATSPQSTKIVLNLGGRIVLSAPYQKAMSPLNGIEICEDRLPDVERDGEGNPLYSYCRSVLVDLEALAEKEQWDRPEN